LEDRGETIQLERRIFVENLEVNDLESETIHGYNVFLSSGFKGR
jgi:hypothetical protein